MSNDSKQTFYQVWQAFLNSSKALNQLIPGITMIIMILVGIIIYISVSYSKVMMGIIVILVFLIALAVYIRTKNFGEAALSLVAGMLAAFTVQWTSNKFIVFTGVWIGFSLLVLMISSVRLASKVEDIYRQAAMFIDSDNYLSVEKQLKKYSKSTPLKMLGPIERAEIVLILSFQKIEPELMNSFLRVIEQINVITKEDYKTVTIFFANVYKAIQLTDISEISNFVDKIVNMIKEVPASPQDFFLAFGKSKHRIISGTFTIDKYFQLLCEALTKGIPPEKIDSYIINTR